MYLDQKVALNPKLDRILLVVAVLSSASFFITQKLQERQATLTKSTMAQKEKDKWAKVLVADMMSNEESDLGMKLACRIRFFIASTAKWKQ